MHITVSRFHNGKCPALRVRVVEARRRYVQCRVASRLRNGKRRFKRIHSKRAGQLNK